MADPFKVVRDFEAALCEYTGAKYAVTTNSCTMALLLAVAWHMRGLEYDADRVVSIPKRTYVGVPQSIIHAGAKVEFRDEDWFGWYQLKPLPVWDSARLFTKDMYCTGKFFCVSFHATKILADTQGGAILHDDPGADAWLRRARFDGRTEGVPPIADKFDMVGWHCYMSPDVAARLTHKLATLPAHTPPLPNDNYPDLSLVEAFKR
jgi:dTDP-4-amino-4,6-dideoxygalactose transaminase